MAVVPRRHRPSRATVALGVALFAVLGGGNAYAAAVNCLLNTANTSTAQTSLDGSAVAGKASLKLVNTNAATGSTPLALTTASGHAPLTVSAGAGRVANLNADKLDGLDSTRLQRRVTGTCAGGSAMSAVGASGAVSCAAMPQIVGAGSASGPFPTPSSVATFTTDGGPLLLSFSASAFRLDGPGQIDVQVVLCSSSPCSASNGLLLLAERGYTNEASSHETMPARFWTGALAAGTYFLNVVPDETTTTDGSDWADVDVVQF